MSAITQLLLSLSLALLWIHGVVLAVGFWSTLLAIIFPLWAWYLAVEWAAVRFL